MDHGQSLINLVLVMQLCGEEKRTYRREDIIKEYNQSAEFEEEFRKAKWGSFQSMMNRFELAMKELSFAEASHWFDVGCGTGAFQAVAKQQFPHLKSDSGSQYKVD